MKMTLCMKTRWVWKAIGCATLAGLAACSTANKDPYAAKQDGLSTSTTRPENDPNLGRPAGEYPQIEVEARLRRWIAVSDPAVTQGEVMKVTVPVRVLSDAGEFARVQYQFMFFDEAGVPLRVQPDWRYVRLEPRRQEFISATSNDTAASWRLRIQSNR